MLSFTCIKRLGENVADHSGQKYCLEVGFGSRENRFLGVSFR